MIYRVLIEDRDLSFYNEIRKPLGLNWEYNALGGCGAFGFTAYSKFCTDILFGSNFNIKILRRNPTTKNYDLWYQGRIEDKQYDISSGQEIVSISGYGYQSALNDVIINQDFTSQEASVIVKSILDTFVVPNTKITYDNADIEATTLTIDSIKFSYVTAAQALKTIAEAVGGREWGVDRNRKFFFKAQSSTTGFNYALGKKVKNLRVNNSSRSVANHIIIQGGDVSGSPFVYVKDYLSGQAKYGRRDLILQRTAVVTNQIAQQIADAAYAERSDVSERVRCDLLDEVLIENTLPIPLFKIKTREYLYDEANYDSILYSGIEPQRISKVRYKIGQASELIISMELGQVFASEVENIKQLEFKLDQLRQAR